MINYFFPIETTARELDFKIIMAVQAAEKNRKIFVGEQQSLRNLSFFIRDGVFFGKHLFGKPKFSDTKYYKRLKKNNFSVVHLNEEGGVWPGRENEWNKILEFEEKPTVLDKNDYLLEWGQYQKSFYDNLEDHSTNIVVTGHPRFDLLKSKFLNYYQKDVEKLKSKYKDFILVNTSFSFPNNAEGNQFTFRKTINYDPSNLEQREFRYGKWVNQTCYIAYTVDLVNQLSLKFPDKIIILRPHPSENSETYNAVFKNIKNVLVIFEGNIIEWLLACGTLITSGSTTALEAVLANKLVISYFPDDNYFAPYIPSNLGFKCQTIDSVVKLIQEKHGQHVYYDFEKIESVIKQLINNFNSESMPKILEIFKIIDERFYLSSRRVSFFKLKFLGYLNYFYYILKYSYMILNSKKEKYNDFKKRFSKFNRTYIKNKVSLAEQMFDKRVKLSYINSYLFTIEIEH